MTRLKLGAIPDDKPVKLTVELPADVHRDLCAYADALARQNGQKVETALPNAPLLARAPAANSSTLVRACSIRCRFSKTQLPNARTGTTISRVRSASAYSTLGGLVG